VTGARDRLPEGAEPMLRRVRSLAGGVPVAAGFGVSTPEQARALAGVADGVVVGSALVAELVDGGADGPARLGRRVRLLSDAMRQAGASAPARSA
ncbi:MAG TPA: tryptophan synthase subunit alpha, partial [Candidatus Binatia bacterium]|nr:tryptophan synthase subunit alpha [Candidatus Binatia bacterium]